MDSEEIKKIIKDYSDKGYSIKVRDIMYALLRNKIDDDLVIYQSLYGIENDINVVNDYAQRDDIKQLIISFSKSQEQGGISFDENKKGMEQNLAFMENLVKDPTLKGSEVASLMGQISGIRVKLYDKFGADEKKDEQRIIVNTHYNHICDTLHKECLFYNKEYAMKKWNLIEKPKK